MKKTKKLLSLMLAVPFLLPVVPVAFAQAASDEPFQPVIRFVAASDTHVRDSDNVTADRIGKMMRLAYAEADSHPTYQKIDALLIAGDLTNDGTKTEFDKFQNAVNNALRPGTQFLGVVAKNHDGYELPRKEMRAYYSEVSANDADFHVVINGYHFIGVSASENQAAHYDSNQLKWFREQLDKAVADKPNQPVFVMHHEHNTGTVYGSSSYDRWGVSYFKNILNKYPQAVDLSGHSHYPLNDPRSLWQGKFTAIGTGAIYYAEFTVEGLRTYHPADAYEVATCWIVELDANGNLHLRGMDVNAGACLCEYTLQNPADPANRDYTPRKRKAASTAPVFADDAKVTVMPTFGGCTVQVPAAQSTDGMPIVLYRVTAKDRLGLPVVKNWTMPSYYLASTEEPITLTVENLASGTYTICVTAETAYGVRSAPIKTTVTVEGKGAFESFFARLQQLLQYAFAVIKSWF